MGSAKLSIFGLLEYLFMRYFQVIFIILGFTPFHEEDPLLIYEAILHNKVKFTKNFDKSALSLVRHLVERDLSKRYGNLV